MKKLKLAQMPVSSPTVASGDQNATQQKKTWCVQSNDEAWPEEPLLLSLLSHAMQKTESHTGARPCAVFQNTVWDACHADTFICTCWYAELFSSLGFCHQYDTDGDEGGFVCGSQGFEKLYLSDSAAAFLSRNNAAVTLNNPQTTMSIVFTRKDFLQIMNCTEAFPQNCLVCQSYLYSLPILRHPAYLILHHQSQASPLWYVIMEV